MEVHRRRLDAITMNQSVSQPQPLDIRSLRHDIRGRMNALVLCASALDETCQPHESLEFLDHIIKTTDKLVALLDRLESVS